MDAKYMPGSLADLALKPSREYTKHRAEVEDVEFLQEQFADALGHIADLHRMALNRRKTNAEIIDFYHDAIPVLFRMLVECGVMTKDEIQERYCWDLDDE